MNENIESLARLFFCCFIFGCFFFEEAKFGFFSPMMHGLFFIRRKSLSRTIFKFFARSLLLKEAKFHHFSKKKSLERFLSFTTNGKNIKVR